MRIKHQILLAMGFVVLLASAVFSAALYQTHKTALLDGIDGRLLTAAEFAEAVLPAGYHDAIEGRDSVSPDEYRAIVETWNNLCRKLDLQYIWSLIEIDGQIVFTTGTSTSKDLAKGDYARFFDVHTAPETYRQAFDSMQIQYSTFHDQWGAGRMVLLPAVDARGRKHLFAASMSLEEVNARLTATLAQAGAIGGAIFALGMALSIVLASSISGPIVKVTEVAERIARGELGQSIEARGGRELMSLSQSISEMSQAIGKKVGELKASEERARKLFEGIDDALFVHDQDGRILTCNQAACRRLGYTREELVGMNTRDIDAPEFAQGFEDRLVEQLDEASFACEGVHVTKEGRRIPVDINTSAIDYDGKKAVLAVMRDITERKRAEDERKQLEAQVQHAQKLESLGVLAGGIAHDFNNLLMGVLGYADIALSDLAPEAPARDSIEEIGKAARRAAELAKQMLAYSGKGRFTVKAINLSSLVEEMAHLLEVSISKKTTMKYRFAENLPSIEADATQIRQVVMNLITNASDAIGDAAGVIAVSTGVTNCDRNYLSETYLDENLAQGKYVYVEVSDTGCGMTNEQKERIFDPFYTTKFTGRGLGLAAVLGIVRGHRGAIKVYSEPGKGTSFKVLFPASSLTENVDTSEGPDEGEWEGTGTVLIVDDEETVRAVTGQMLKAMGFTVLTATDGQQGVEVFNAYRDEISVVLLDMTMPRMSGEEVFAEIRRIRKGICVILSSGYNEEDATHHFAGKSLAGFIQKPYNSAALKAKLREVLGKEVGEQSAS